MELNGRYEHVGPVQYEHVQLVDEHLNGPDGGGPKSDDGPMSVHDDAPNDDRNDDDVDNGLVHSW